MKFSRNLVLLFCLVAMLSFGTLTLIRVYAAPLNGQIRGSQKISAQQGSLGDVLSNGARFGSAVTALGDLDGDGIGDLAVGAANTANGNLLNQGAVWLLFLKRDGTVKAKQAILPPTEMAQSAFFGTALTKVGDLDGDGVPELAIGAPFANQGGPGRGAIGLFFLNRDGTVKRWQTISATTGGFKSALADDDFFGSALTSLGDLNRDGVVDLAVGAPGSDDGGADGSRGAMWILFLNADGSVKTTSKISATAGGFGGFLYPFDQLGQSIANLGDLNSDGVTDLAAGVLRDDSDDKGALWIIFLKADGTVKAQQEVGLLSGRFGSGPSRGARYGSAVTGIGDLDLDNVPDLIVGASGQIEEAKQKNQGTLWRLNLKRDGLVKNAERLTDKSDKVEKGLKNNDQYGWSVTTLGDINGDGVGDLAIGAPGDDDGGLDRGAVWIVFMKK